MDDIAPTLPPGTDRAADRRGPETPDASMLRHELRTPLNAVIGYSEILIEEGAEEDFAGETIDALRSIHSQANALLGLVNDVFDPRGAGPSGGVSLAERVRRLREPAAAMEAECDALFAATPPDSPALQDLARIAGAARTLRQLSERAPGAPVPHGHEAPAAAGHRVPTHATGALTLQQPATVLVVDDVEANRELLARRLEALGHTVLSAADGQSALDTLARGGVDLLILDVMMPGMSGLEVLGRIKSDPALRAVRVIMASAMDELDGVVQCLELGADDYLPKPFNPVLLRARVGACLERQRLREKEVAAREAEHKRKTAELEYARGLQLSLLPAGHVDAGPVEVVGRMSTASEVGGDYYDFLPIGDGRLLVTLGDATGHGVAAGLVVAMTKMGLTLGLGAFAEHGSLERLVGELNTALRASMPRRGIGMALAAATIDPRVLTAELSSNGIPYPYHYSARERSLTPLRLQAPPIGFLSKVPVPTARVALEPGDSLVMLSDGFTERVAAGGEMWGDDAVERELLAACGSGASAAEIADRLCAACDAFAAGMAPTDDMSVVVVRARD